MAKYSNTISYQLKTTVDKTGLLQLQMELNKVNSSLKDLSSRQVLPDKNIDNAINKISKLQNILNSSFDSKLGMLDMSKFSKELSAANISVKDIASGFTAAGTKGNAAFNNLITTLGKVDTGLRTTSSLGDKLFNTIGNTVRWGLVAGAFQSIQNEVRRSIDYIRELDRSLNDIRIVSDYNAEEMRQFSLEANNAAKALSATTVEYTDASLIFAQQGYSLEDAQKLADLTIQVANTTQQSTAETSEQITAWMNGYQMSIDELKGTLDSVTSVAAFGASDTEELMTAATKVASVASSLGVTQDQLISQMSTIISVTREAPESVGNSLKTLYARLGDLELGETLEDGVSLGEVSGTLEKVGVAVLDANGDLRDMGTIIEELMQKWNSFDDASQQAIAEKLAGKYQYNRFVTLMENQEMYNETLQNAIDSEGFLEKTQNIYTESLNAKLKQIQASWEGLWTEIFDGQDFKDFLGSISQAIDLVKALSQSIGGLGPILTGVGALGVRTFSDNIGKGISSSIRNINADYTMQNNIPIARDMLKQFGSLNPNDRTVNTIARGLDYADNFDETDRQTWNKIVDDLGASSTNFEKATEDLRSSAEAVIRFANASDALLAESSDIEDVKKYRVAQGYTAGTLPEPNEAVYGYNDLQDIRKYQLAFNDVLVGKANDEESQSRFAELDRKFGEAGDTALQAAKKVSAILDVPIKKGSQISGYLSNGVGETGTPPKGGVIKNAISQTTEAYRAIGQYDLADNVENLYTTLITDLKQAEAKAREDGGKIDPAPLLSTLGELQDELEASARIVQKDFSSALARGQAPGNFTQMEEDRKTAETINTVNQDLAEGFIDKEELELSYSSVVKLASSVGELAFAWQAFQNLGSIWTNADLDTGEKLGQTITNLAMVLPSAIDGWVTLKTTLNSKNGLSQVVADLRQTGDLAVTAGDKTGLAAAKARVAGLGFKSAATGVELFGKALNWLTGPIGIIVSIGATLISTLDSFNKAAKENRTEELLNTYSEAANKFENIQSTNAGFQDLRKEYEDTGSASEEFVKSLEDVGKALGVTDTSLLISTGHYEQLIEKIDEATQKAKEQAATTATSARSALEDEMASNNGPFGILGSKEAKDVRDIFANDGTRTTVPIFIDPNKGYMAGNVRYEQQVTNQSELAQKFADKLNTAADERNWAEIIGLLNQIVSEVEDAENPTEQDLAAKQSALNALNSENLKQEANLLQTGAAADISSMSFDENATAQEIYDQIANSANSSDYFLKTLSSDSERYAFILENLSNDVNKSTLNLAYAESSFTENLAKKLEGTTLADESIITAEQAQEVSANILKQINASDLSEEDKLELIAGIDWEKSLPQINSEITQAVESGSIDSIRLKGEFDANGVLKSSNIDDEELGTLLDDYGLSQETFDTFVDQIESQSSEQTSQVLESAKAYNEKAKAQEEATKADYEAAIQAGKTGKELEDLEDAYKNAQTASKRSAKAEEASERNLRDVAAAAIKSGAAVDDLSENFEDYEKILTNADKSSLQYAETMATVRKDVADALGVEFESVDADFVENNLDTIREAANGSEDAVNELRVALATDIVGKMDIEGPNPEETKAELLGLIDELRTLSSETPIGVDVDVNNDQAFVKLNELLASGAVTAEQMEEYLNSVGFDPDITTVTQHTRSSSSGKFYLGGDGNYGTPSIEIPWSSEMDMDVEVPQITGAKSIEGIQVAGIGASSPRSASGGGKKNSGGSGSKPKSSKSGSNKEYEAKQKDKIEEQIDRYERVNAQLEGVGNDLEKINQEEDRLSGWNLADNFKEQNKLLTKQIALYEEKLKIQKEEVQELRNELSSQYGLTFDAEGYIQNYAATHRKLEQEVNNLINQYNATTTEAGQEALEKQIEAAQEKLDKFKEKYQRYDELFAGEMRETINTIEDLRNEIEDLNIELFDKAVDAADTIKDIQEAFIEFQQVFSGLDSDDPFRAMATSAQKLSKYFDVVTSDMNTFYDTWLQRTEQLQKEATTPEAKAFYGAQIKDIQAAKAASGNGSMEAAGSGYLDMAFGNLSAILQQLDEYEANKYSSIFGENQAALYETAKNVFDQATSMIADFESEIENLRDSILDAIDDIGDRMDWRVEQYEFMNEQLEHQLDILEMIKGEKAYDDQNMILAAQNKNYLDQIANLREYLSVLEDLKASFDEGSEEWRNVQEKIMDAQGQINDLVESSLDALTKQYENTVNKVLDNWTSSPFGNDLDWIAQEWELINRNADYYLDATNKAYNIQKLQGKYLDMLDGTNDLHIQQKITQQMNEQLGYLRDKKNLSEYDVQYANMQLEILQKTIALEEARNNKNQMKLRRDAQGNYSYVYTADEGDVKKAEEDLLDVQNNAYNLSKEQMKQTQADSLSALQDAKSILDSIWNDANISLEEKQKRTRTVIDSLREYLDGTSEQLSTSEQNIINDFIGMVELMTEENAANLQDIYDQIINGNVDAFDQIDTRWSTSLTDWLQNLEDFNVSTDQMFDNLTSNMEDFSAGIKDISAAIGSDLTDVGQAIENVRDQTDELNKTTEEFFNQLKQDSGIIKEHEKTLQSYANKITDVTNEMRAYQNQVNELQDKLTKQEQQNATLKGQIQQLTNPSASGSSSSGSGGSKGENARAGDIVGYKGQYFYDSGGKRPLGSLYSGKANAVRISSFSGAPYGNGKTYGDFKVHIEDLKGGHLGWIKSNQLFDTGGFTGSWSGSGNPDAKDGKLAWLHQKELVLNSSDTSNILSAVSIVRDFADNFKNAFGNTMNALGSFSAVKADNSMDVNQDVHITAEFPNASSTSEIEAALLGLNERAVQYAFKTA